LEPVCNDYNLKIYKKLVKPLDVVFLILYCLLTSFIRTLYLIEETFQETQNSTVIAGYLYYGTEVKQWNYQMRQKMRNLRSIQHEGHIPTLSEVDGNKNIEIKNIIIVLIR